MHLCLCMNQCLNDPGITFFRHYTHWTVQIISGLPLWVSISLATGVMVPPALTFLSRRSRLLSLIFHGFLEGLQLLLLRYQYCILLLLISEPYFLLSFSGSPKIFSLMALMFLLLLVQSWPPWNSPAGDFLAIQISLCYRA